MTLKLFYWPNTCALASHIALEDSGAAYETARVNFSRGDQFKPEYLAINPKARVPALVTDRGVLTETPAILAYIAQTFPDAQLAPLDDAFAFARLQSLNAYLCATVHVAHAHRSRGMRWTEDPAAIEALKKKVPQNMSDCFDIIERDMPVGPWVMGETYSVADAYLFTVSSWLESDGVDPAKFPKVLDHRNRMGKRPAVIKVLAEESRA